MDIAKLLIIFFFSLYNFYLFISGNIDNYISQRFFSFSLIASLIGIIFSLAGIIYLFIKDKNKQKFLNTVSPLITLTLIIIIGIIVNPLFLILSIPLFIYFKKDIKIKFDLGILILIVAILGFIIPSTSLTSITATQRSGDFNSVTLDDRLSTISRFADSANYDIGDWIASINYNPDINSYIGKDVDVVGFVFQNQNSTDNLFVVARFVVTCCAVDARPVGLNVRMENWSEKFSSDEWVNVKGKFAEEEVGGNNVLVIVADEVSKTIEPERPYIY